MIMFSKLKHPFGEVWRHVAKQYYLRKSHIYTDAPELLAQAAQVLHDNKIHVPILLSDGYIWVEVWPDTWIKYNNGFNSVSKVALTTGSVEAKECEYFTKYLPQKGSFLDIGANVGLYSIYAAKTNGLQCFAFEPVDATSKDLLKNVQFNGCKDKVQLFKVGLSDKKGEASITAEFHASNYISENNTGNASQKIRIDTLDTIVKKNKISDVSAIKIDVEGHESKVLAGGMKTIKRFMPILFVEIITADTGFENRPKYSHVEVIKALTDLGYKYKIIDDNGREKSFANYMFYT